MSRLVIGNLDAEIEMARAATPGPHPALSAATARLVARHAEHVRVFARPGDRLWVPGDATLEREVAGTDILAWAETDAVASLRSLPVARPPSPVPGLLLSDTWTERLWQLHTTPGIARACNDRRFAFDLACREGWTLPGARVVTSLDELPRDSQRWVAKAIFSAAGRERVRFSGDEERLRLERLLSRFGALLLEPWVDRLLDLGCAGLVDVDRVEVFPPHRLDSDAAGVFRAAVIDDAGDAIAEPPVLAAVRGTAEAAGAALAAAGYLGPFSVDAYLWRDRAGAVQLQRLSEINARLTFGLVARAAAGRASTRGGRFELRL